MVMVGLIENLVRYKGIPKENIIMTTYWIHGIPPSQLNNVIYWYMRILSSIKCWLRTFLASYNLYDDTTTYSLLHNKWNGGLVLL